MSKSVTKEKQSKQTNTRGRKKIKPSNSNTLDKWILREKNSVSSNIENIDSVNEKETKRSKNEGKMKKSKNSKSIKRQPSGSFTKYGVILPTFEEALTHKQELDKLKKAIDEFDVSDDSIERFVLETEEPIKAIRILDCKHLSDEELRQKLEQNYEYLYNIVHGISKSERHKKFTTAQYKTGTRTDDLTYNTSMITFTFEQKQLLLHYLSKNFGDNNQYFFKVLLPELCTKIFMDTHNMTYSEAVSYLDSRPPQPIESI